MSYPVDVEESPEMSSVGDYKTPLLFGLSRVSDRPFGDYSDASPEKEVGEIDQFYSPISQFDENVLQPINNDWLTRMRMEFRAISRRWLRTGDSPTYFGDCTQSKAEEEAHASFSWRESVIKWREEEIQDNGYTPMHVAASNGDLETLRTLIETNKNKCLRRDKHGGTPLHAAAKSGRVEALKVILEACPETVKKVTVQGENCLHTAVLYNQVGAVRFLVEWLKRNRDYAHLINGKDYDGKTPLHLATSRIQIQTLEALLTSNMVDVNATTCGGFTALDILSVLPRTGINEEIDTILFEAGALRGRDLANRDANSYAARGYKRKWFNMNTIIPFINMVVLLVATWVTTRTYQAAFTAFGATFNDGGSALSKQESIITGLFLLFNAMAFIGSLAVAILVVHKLSAHAA